MDMAERLRIIGTEAVIHLADLELEIGFLVFSGSVGYAIGTGFEALLRFEADHLLFYGIDLAALAEG